MEPERCRATGKIRHPDPVTAERVRKRVRRAKGGQPSIYKCHYCNGRHVGRTSPGRKD